MKTITFTCETITPMFLSGADGQTPELRPPSIKGALRFWWRAVNGHLDLKSLKEQESLIFGGTDPARRSSLIVRIENHNETESKLKINYKAILVPHRGTSQKAFYEKQKFNVVLCTINEKVFDVDKLCALFQLVCLLGGFGKRTRRGMGSLKINKYKIDKENWVENDQVNNLQDVYKYLKILSDQFELGTKDIKSKIYKGEKYPYIEKIEIGRIDSKILNKVSITTHELKSMDKFGYEASLGNTFKGRFASPIYVSVLDANIPIITTLKTCTNQNVSDINKGLQEEFKKRIL